MYLKTKIIFCSDGQKTVRVFAFDWEGKRYGLEVDGEFIKRGSYEVIIDEYERYGEWR